MKKTLLLSLLALSAIACTISPKGFVINGTVEDTTLNGQTIYLSDYNKDGKIDSTVIADGTFTFTGKLENPTVLRIDIKRLFADILAENGKTINVIMGRPSIVEDNGGLNSEKKIIDSTLNAIFAPYYQKQKELREQGITGEEMRKELSILAETLSPKHKEATEKYMNEHKENLIGAMMFWSIMYDIETLAKFDSMYTNILHSKVLKPLAKYRETLVNTEKTAPGQMFIDFKGTAIDGSESALSEFVGKGKYVLVDFWASWCGPCKGEIPNLKELHEKYGKKNFMVLGVNVWDKKDKFEEAIKEEGMTWSHLYASDTKDATDLYGISGIPQIILFAPDGTIVERNLRGEDMKAKVAKLFK